jgi:hypothetical protein
MGAIAKGDGRVTPPIFIGVSTTKTETAEIAEVAEKNSLWAFRVFRGFCVQRTLIAIRTPRLVRARASSEW